MTVSEIEAAILKDCRSEWLKVAMVIYSARAALSLPDDESNDDLIALQVGELVKKRQLEAVGDLSNWRGSEIRLAR